jgi:hypothetical protein
LSFDVREIVATAEQIAVLFEVRDLLKRKTPRCGVCSLVKLGSLSFLNELSSLIPCHRLCLGVDYHG